MIHKKICQVRCWLAPILLVSLVCVLSACVKVGSISQTSNDGGPDRDVDVSHVKDATPRYEPITKAGNSSPYKVLGKTYHVDFDTKGFRQEGKASWYGKKFHGNKTANGEVYDMFAMTAAHKTLPIPSYVRVTNLDNKRTVVVRVNDRGPFHYGRIIDLSYAAAKKLDIQNAGTGNVRVDIVTPAQTTNQLGSKQHDTAVQSYLQVGAFREHSGAVNLKNRIVPLTSIPVVITPQTESKFYKVLVGPIVHQEEIIALKRKFSDLKLSDPHLIKW